MWHCYRKVSQPLHDGSLELAKIIRKGHYEQASILDSLGFGLTVFPPRIMICSLERVKGGDEHIGQTSPLHETITFPLGRFPPSQKIYCSRRTRWVGNRAGRAYVDDHFLIPSHTRMHGGLFYLSDNVQARMKINAKCASTCCRLS